MPEASSTMRSTKASWMPSCTSTRLALIQVCPELRNLATIIAAITSSRSASSKTRNGALPPNSSETFLIVFAHCPIKSLPTSVEPVNESLRTIGLLVISPPIFGASSASPVTTLSTPAGRPTRSASTITERADSGVCSAGLSTIEQPAASAGAALRVGIADGKFHGVIPTVTPIGSRKTTMRRSGIGAGIVSPLTRFASSPNHSKNDAA